MSSVDIYVDVDIMNNEFCYNMEDYDEYSENTEEINIYA